MTDNSSKDSFSFYRLKFSQNSFELEGGELQDGAVHFQPVSEGRLSFSFEPSLLTSDDNTEAFLEIIDGSLKGKIPEASRFAVILPQEWGFTVDIPHPGAIPQEELEKHIQWAAKTNCWEDREYIYLNYLPVNSDRIRISAVRERVVEFAKELADRLSVHLLQLSLANTTQLNLISNKALTSAVEKTPEEIEKPIEEALPAEEATVVEAETVEDEASGFSFDDLEPETEKAAAEEEDLSEKEKSPAEIPFKKKSPLKTVIIALIIVILCSAGYLIYSNLGTDIAGWVSSIWSKSEKPVAEVIEGTTVVQSESAEPVKSVIHHSLFSELVREFNSDWKLKFLSISEDFLKCEIFVPTAEKLDSIINIAENSGLLLSPKSSQTNESVSGYDAIITGTIKEQLLMEYNQPPAQTAYEIIESAGFKLDRGIFRGKFEDVIGILKTLDENKILFYRLVLVKEGDNFFTLSLEY